MELTYDWRSFQSVFFPRMTRRTMPEPGAGTAYFITEGDTIVAGFADNEDLTDWVGAPVSEVATHFEGRPYQLFERADVEASLSGAVPLPHYFSQMRRVQDGSFEFMRHGTRKTPSRRSRAAVRYDQQATHHFLLAAIDTWWAKVFPSAYGVFLRISGGEGDVQDFLLTVRRGNIESFCMPDISSLGPERRMQKDQVVRYLSEKHLIPVQGIFVGLEEWTRWNASDDPWSEVAAAVRADHSLLYPFRWGLVTLIATRAFIGI